MKFIIDAHLSKSLSQLLNERGFDSIHTRDLPEGNATKDEEITSISLREQRIVISKDADFYNRFLQKSEPFKLLVINTGNITTKDILTLFEQNFNLIIEKLEYNEVVELSRKSIIVIL